MGFLNVLRQRLAKLNAGFSAGQKTIVVLSVVALAAGGFLFTKWASKPTYAPLFSNLSSADAAAITEKLDSEGVPYQLADGGNTILVPSDKVYQTRLDASAEGLPANTGEGGYTLLDKQGVTTSEFRQRVDFQRAMEGELSKTIQSMDGVESATVHLVIPPEDVFSDSEQKPSASVLLKTRAGASLSDDQVQAVDHLIASAISGLDPQAITIADSKGTVLLAPGTAGSTAGTSSRLKQVQAFETARAADLQTMLDKVVGPGNAVVKVNADLDFDQRVTTAETYGKTKAPALSSQQSSETYGANGSNGSTGVLGPDSNVSNGTSSSSGSSGNGNYGKSESTTNFGVDKTTEQIEAAGGKINRLTVSVLINGKASVNPADLQKSIAAAAGINTARGDVLDVSRIPFDDSAASSAAADEKQAASQQQRAQLIGYAQTGALVLLVVVVLLLAFLSMRKAAKASRTPIDLTELERQRAVLTRTDVAPEPAAEPEPVAAGRQLELAAEDRQRLAVQEEVGELIQRQPEEVARLLRSWLADRRT
jgi:flagellar M-ring protein FliF